MHPTVHHTGQSPIAPLHRHIRTLTTRALPGEPRKPPRRSPARTEATAVTVPAPGPADRARLRQLENMGGWTRRERLRVLWYRLRLTVQEMNYATRRLVELQMRLP